jgi:hypothetical protein
MTTAARAKQSVWYKAYYDKIAVLAVLIALLISAVILLLRVSNATRELQSMTRVDDAVTRLPYQVTDLSDFTPFVKALENPFRISTRDQLLLVSDLRIISANPDVRTPVPLGAEVCPWTQYPQPTSLARDTTGDGIPDEWYVSFGLSAFDPELAGRDLDGDGFTVREEFESGTSPVDAEDHPSYAQKLRVRRVAARPFDLRFQGVQEIAEGDVRFMLNVRDQNRSYFARMNETVRGYTIVAYEPRTQPGPFGNPVDASVLNLQRADGRIVELGINQDVTIDDRVAELLFLVDNSTFVVNNGDEVTLMNKAFKVIDIQRNSVLMLDIERDERVTIRQSNPAKEVNPADDGFGTFGSL